MNCGVDEGVWWWAGSLWGWRCDSSDNMLAVSTSSHSELALVVVVVVVLGGVVVPGGATSALLERQPAMTLSKLGRNLVCLFVSPSALLLLLLLDELVMCVVCCQCSLFFLVCL